jgi:hypothetical protein
MKVTRLALFAAAAAVLAVPAAASAHPSVYTGEARIVASQGPPPTFDMQTRYTVTNHGYTTVLRETNGVSAPSGVVSYALLPSAYRATLAPGKASWLTAGGTGAQAHATCGGVPALADTANILAWQAGDSGEGDPFYNYIPFQKTGAGLDDDPADWVDDVQRLTGVDLTTVSDAAAACVSLGGTFRAADETQNSIAALASGTVEHETAPLNARISELTTFTEQLQAQRAAAQKAAADARAALASAPAGAQAELARLKTRLRLEQSGDRSVKVTGPAGMRVAVRMRLTREAARALGWKSFVLDKETATIGQDSTAVVKLTPTGRALAALRKADANGVYFAVRTGDRWASTRTR